MTSAAPRFLIVNADDFGLSDGVNRGIIRAHEQGIVTSASLMVRQPAAAAAADYAKRRQSLSVGLHLDLGEWAYRAGEWVAVYEVVPADDATAVAEEVGRQLDAFRRLTGRDPTHLDSHQHAHRSEPLRTVAIAAARRLGIPLRHFDPHVRYCGDFYAQTGTAEPLPDAITPPALVRIIHSLPPGTTEFACHPGDDATLDSPYREERLAELRSLCDPAVRTALEESGVQLISFSTRQ
jgi:predicted glycoside hydrolase/deacetylase ChbG (UPF0249 family)